MSDERLDRIATRLDGVEVRLGGVEVRLGGVEVRLGGVEVRLGGVEVRLDGVDVRLDRVEASLSKLTILHEETRDDVKRIAEGLVATNERMDRGFAELRGELGDELRGVNAKMDTFIREQSEANREFRGRFSNHEDRLQSLERRRRAR